ncbi:MAG TPA: ATP-dependent Clp protease ATP-binding subunit ClpX, partial [Sulfuricurvum sp.]|nr:ATP-dependent Clp protease ATP-binding subunit ClpX [Sulfuricurvum sp.]
VAQKAIDRGVGARGLRGIIEEAMLPLQFSCPSNKSIASVTITEAVIDDPSKEPIFTYKEEHAEA